jgi:hypothetical protein
MGNSSLLITNSKLDFAGTDMIPLFSTDLNLQADDFASANWVSRAGNIYATYYAGTGLTKAAATTLPGKNCIKGWAATRNFRIDAGSYQTYNIHMNERYTYEFMFSKYVFGAGTGIFGNIAASGGFFGGMYLTSPSTVSFFSTLSQSTSTTSYLGGQTTTSPLNSNLPNMLTVVVDTVLGVMRVYVNGTQFSTSPFPTTSPTGTCSSMDIPVGIGTVIDYNSGSPIVSGTRSTLQTTCELVALMRHKRIFTADEVLSRCTWFNANKGY